MKNGTRTAVCDKELRLEACRFQGIAQPFPNHFHEHYVIGLVEDGQRVLLCKGREYLIGRGSVLLFGPGDSHACTSSGERMLDYRGLSIGQESMLDWVEAATGKRALPSFPSPVVQDGGLARCMRSLHELVMDGAESLEKEAALLLLLSGVLEHCGQPMARTVPDCRQEVERALAFMEERYPERISLDQLCRHTGLSKSTLLRAFTKARGVTPYRCLESIRVSRARELLAQGIALSDAALQAGFSDQSHFTNSFTSFTGLSPGAYRDSVRGGAGRKKED